MNLYKYNINTIKSELRKDNKKKYLQLGKLGKRINMSFSTCEVFAGKIIGLDESKRKLVMVDKDAHNNPVNIIPLDEISSISIKKNYSSIKSGELKKRKMRHFLKSIFLQFHIGNAGTTIVLPIYDADINSNCDFPFLERKVKRWQVILSKIIGGSHHQLVHAKTSIAV